MTYAETLEYLFALRSLGSKFGLERMRALYEAAGKPAGAIPILHVAGTNGKGSVCAMAEAIFRANGYRTGLFTSPHLERLGERVQVNREILTERQIVDAVSDLRPLCEAIAGDDPQRHPTFFELMTVIALRHFEREGCDVIILETGLGGRLDSTNVVQPAVTAITSIGLDHQELLGETLEQIAAEKAGIIKRGAPLVLGKLPQVAHSVIVGCATQLGVPVFDTQALFDPATLDVAPLEAIASVGAHSPQPDQPSALRPYPYTSLKGAFQRRNAAVALLAAELLCAAHPQITYNRQMSLAALRSVQWAGRWQTQTLADGCELILDSSHNEEGARALEENLSRFVRERGVRPVVVTGALGDARARSLLEVVARHAQALFLVAVQQPRACSLEQLRSAVPADFGGDVFSATVETLFAPGLRAGEVLKQYLQQQNPSVSAVPVLVTGSIYLIGEIMTRLHGDTTAEGVHLQDKISG